MAVWLMGDLSIADAPILGWYCERIFIGFAMIY